jgi:hypothetical protein
MPEYFDRALNILGVLLSALAFIFSFIGARRARQVARIVAAANAGQACRRCYSLARVLVSLTPLPKPKSLSPLAESLHDEIVSLLVRYRGVFTSEERNQLERAVETCKQVVHALSANDSSEEVTNGVRYIQTCMLRIAEEHSSDRV